MGKGSAPKPPDPKETIKEQTNSNIKTASAQANINNVNQVTPGGSLTYTKTVDKNGVPTYTATTALSPDQQKLFDAKTAGSTALAGVVSNGAKELAQPVDTSNAATEARLIELGRSRLDPMLAQRRQDTETDLINRGIRPGSTNYAQARDIASQGENDAYNQLILNGHGQAVNEALAARGQRLNEISVANGGSAVQGPQFVNTPQTGVAGTDTAGITNNAYNTAANNYQRQQQDFYGGLFGLGSAAIGAFSDERLKTNIKPTGDRVAGVPVKTFNWKETGEPDVGVVAQDVQKKHPELVHRDPSGYRKVDYAGLMRIGMRRAA